ncbi:MAG: CoA transferase [Chloroflexi bacterium]|nr:CoA transferase [Chloroflexota bacterium]
MTQPLARIRVFDLTNAGVGPIATELLAGLGADVIKVESPEGDVMRTMLPRQRGFPTAYTSHNFNKRAIVLDLKDTKDRQWAYRLLETCDIFVENFRPGVAKRLGVDYESVSKVNPRIIYISSSAWGDRGPMQYFAGVDPNLQAFSGFASINGPEDNGGEFHRGYGHIDATTASYISSAAIQALIEREQSGQGAHIVISMLGCALNLQITRLAEYFAGEAPTARGTAATFSAPNQAFQCQNHKWVAVTVETDAQWQALCETIRRPDLASDERYATNTGRVDNREELSATLTEIFASKPSIWWTKELTRLGVPNSLFLDFEILREHVQVAANDMMVVIDVPHQGPISTSGYPWRFSEFEVPVLPAPAPDQHTQEVLASLSPKESAETPAPETATVEA